MYIPLMYSLDRNLFCFADAELILTNLVGQIVEADLDPVWKICPREVPSKPKDIDVRKVSDQYPAANKSLSRSAENRTV
jgi:hypothetical protein